MSSSLSPTKRTRRVPFSLMLPVSLLVLLTCLPLLYIVLRAQEAGWSQAAALIFRPRVTELLINTALLVVCVTVSSTLIGLMTAWLIERTNLPKRKLWNALVTLPFAVPAFISSYSWISILPRLEGFSGAVLVLTGMALTWLRPGFVRGI